MIRKTGTNNLFHSLARPRIITTKRMIQKVRKRMNVKKVSVAGELDISNGSLVRIF